jgi:polar amino acid transport system substrate-binding protein
MFCLNQRWLAPLFRALMTIAVIFVALFGAANLPIYANEPIVVVGYPPVSNMEGTTGHDLVVREAFRRIGHDVRFVLEPTKRSIHNANLGIYDAHYLRTASVLDTYPNLVLVPVPIKSTDYVAIVKRDDIDINGWDSLKDYVVGYPLGWKSFERFIDRFGTAVTLSEAAEALRMLDSGNIDVVLWTRNMFRRATSEAESMSLRISGPPLLKRELFLLVHESHRDMVPNLGKALTDMIEDGTLFTFCPTCKP